MDTSQPELDRKLHRLEAEIASLGSALIAYSGGTDSAFLAFTAYRVLGDRMLAVIADSASLPRRELAAALAFAADHGIPLQVLQTAELDDPDYRRNDARRCFHCKDELFSRMEQARQQLGFAALAYGRNLDDDGDFRPGQQAAAQHHAAAPLAAAALTKADVRALARRAGLTLADKPASACLASRLPYGTPVSAKNLAQIEQAEDALHDLGFPQVRVRHHGELARIEIAREDLASALSLTALDAITAALKPIGFLYIALDTQGYRSGSMNDALIAVEAIAAAK